MWETEEYESSLQLARMLNKSDLVTMLQKCVEILVSSPGREFDEIVEKLKEFLTQFQKLEEAYQERDESISPQKELQKKTNLYHLQKTLLELKESRRSKKLTKFEMLRFEVVDYIDSLVRHYLVPADHKTLHEIVYFNTASVLREHLNAAPRIALHTALNNPYSYLKSEALKSDGGSISNKAPDICIAYKLHLECGRLINLADWLEVCNSANRACTCLRYSADLPFCCSCLVPLLTTELIECLSFPLCKNTHCLQVTGLESFHRIIEWPGLKRTIKITWFQPPCHGLVLCLL